MINAIVPGIRLEYRIVESSGVHAVLVDYNQYSASADADNNRDPKTIRIIQISRYPVAPRFNGNTEDFKFEIRLFAEAVDKPILNPDNSDAWGSFLSDCDWTTEVWSDERTIVYCRRWLD